MQYVLKGKSASFHSIVSIQSDYGPARPAAMQIWM